MNFFDWERMKIAGNTEHNRQIDALRESCEKQTAYNNQQRSYDQIIKELQESNKLAIKEAAEAKKSSYLANIISGISIGVAIISIAVSVFLHFFG